MVENSSSDKVPEPDNIHRYPRPEIAGQRRHRQAVGRRPLIWPLMLIGAGVLLLLRELGYVDLDLGTLAWRYWPILLVLVGIDLLFGGHSPLVTLLSVLVVVVIVVGLVAFLLLGVNAPSWIADPGVRLTREAFSYPLEGVRETEVDLDLGRWPVVVSALDDPGSLIEGQVVSTGSVQFSVTRQDGRAMVALAAPSRGGVDWLKWVGRRDEEWSIGLSPDVALDLGLDCGSGRGNFDLRELQLRQLHVDGGSGTFELALPTEWGMTGDIDIGSGSAVVVLPSSGSAEFSIDGGTGSLIIALPREMAARVELESGSGWFEADDRFELVEGEPDGDGFWETQGYGSAERRVLLSIDQGSGSVTITGVG